MPLFIPPFLRLFSHSRLVRRTPDLERGEEKSPQEENEEEEGSGCGKKRRQPSGRKWTEKEDEQKGREIKGPSVPPSAVRTQSPTFFVKKRRRRRRT